MADDFIEINRAPVLTLWMSVVAKRMGHGWECALTIGKVFAGLNAQAKGRMLGIFTTPSEPTKKRGLGEEYWVRIGDRGIPMDDKSC